MKIGRNGMCSSKIIGLRQLLIYCCTEAVKKSQCLSFHPLHASWHHILGSIEDPSYSFITGDRYSTVDVKQPPILSAAAPSIQFPINNTVSSIM